VFWWHSVSTEKIFGEPNPCALTHKGGESFLLIEHVVGRGGLFDEAEGESGSEGGRPQSSFPGMGEVVIGRGPWLLHP